MADVTVDLPFLFPRGNVDVEKESHLYRVIEGDTNDQITDEYTLRKAPIKEIEEVTGVYNGDSGHTFVKGTDYELSADNERIVWLNGDRPDDNTDFFVDYRSRSIIDRYLESGEEELDEVEAEIEETLSSKVVSGAQGEELDRIGALFGETIGKRRGRTDQQYRLYLKSVARSFISRGTKSGIKTAISAATDVPVGDITIIEDFNDNAYEVVVVPNTPVKSQVLNDVAEIADPSGVERLTTRFDIDDDAVAARDEAVAREPTSSAEILGADDGVAISSAATSLWNDYDWNDENWAG